MNEFDEYLARLSEDEVAELERVNDNYLAAAAMEPGPEQERILDALYADAARLDSALHMVSARMFQLFSVFERGAHAEGFRLFVPTMELLKQRRHEIPESTAEAMSAMVVQPLSAMLDDPAVPRATVEGFLNQLDHETRRSGHGAPELAVARAYWHAHTGERDAAEDWMDRWLAEGSDWWAPEKTMTIGLMSAITGAFDAAEALRELDVRVPGMVGAPHRIMTIEVDRAGYLAVCGKTDDAWEALTAAIDGQELDAVARRCAVWAMVRATDGAPIPGAREIVDVAEENLDLTTLDAIEDLAAVARFHLLRGDSAHGERRRAEARERARAYDARNGTGHHSALLERRWFADA
ncbi:hypothetical protein REH65_25505 [Saccharopolyspora sp. ID03-671]|uniref:hypothetical protein n=1 Tax=Saccharopolyspora sp. ID03-671 TaxID=3073066 RepID=UPI00324518E8